MPEGSSSLEEGYKTPKKRTTVFDGNTGSTEAGSSVTQDKSPRARTGGLSFESSLNGSPGGVSISSDDRLCYGSPKYIPRPSSVPSLNLGELTREEGDKNMKVSKNIEDELEEILNGFIGDGQSPISMTERLKARGNIGTTGLEK